MQNYELQNNLGYDSGLASGGQYAQNQFCAIPTQNPFGPLSEWVGYSLDAQDSLENMDVQWIPVRNKRRRFNTGSPSTGTDQINISSLSVDDKLSQMLNKLNNLEKSNQEIVKISQNMSNVQVKVEHIESRTATHDLFLKVLAYKSIDIEARSRRCNLIFHGLAENKDENLPDKLSEFLWKEMCIDSDDLYIGRVHRLGSFHKAKQRQRTDNPRRPIIIAFEDYKSTETVLSAAYMLKGSNFSVTRDYPKEIVAARQRLMPRLKLERQNKNNKVSLEYPARLLINGRVVADEFPDWYSVLEHDRYQMANGTSIPAMVRPQRVTVQSPATAPSGRQVETRGRENVEQSRPVRSYSQVVSAGTSGTQPNNTTISDTQPPGTFSTNVPRYTTNGAGNQNGQCVNTPTTILTTTTMNTTTGSSSMNVSGNGIVPRDQPSYINL